jgi:uncharacterized protein
MRNLLEFILIHLVTHPDEVKVEESTNYGRQQFMISVHAEDVGRVIGRQGRIIEALRSLGKVRAMKDNIAVNIRLAE